MADYLVTDTELTSIADAIRTKGGTSADLSFPTGFVSAINAISGGGGLEYEEGTWSTTSSGVRDANITFSNTHSKPPTFAVINTVSSSIPSATKSALIIFLVNIEEFNGEPFYQTSGNVRYAYIFFLNKTTATVVGVNNTAITYPYSDTRTSQGYPRYWYTDSGVSFHTSSSTYSFIPNATYKWMAIWT